jgi:hypothetical protein
MLMPEEIEAAVVGAQWVPAQGDAALAKGARDLVAKIGAVVPERLRPFVFEPATGGPARWNNLPYRVDMACLRTWIRTGRKITLRCRDEQDQVRERIVWPAIVGYLDGSAICRACAWLGLELDEAANREHKERISTPNSRVATYVIKTDENLMIARYARGTGGKLTSARWRKLCPKIAARCRRRAPAAFPPLISGAGWPSGRRPRPPRKCAI